MPARVASAILVRVIDQKMPVMPTSLKDRADRLERRVSALAEAMEHAPRQRDWRATFDASVGDEGFEEMIRLGRGIRRKQRTASGPDADPGH
jgi:hypothetical protein